MERKTLNMPLWMMAFLTPTRFFYETVFKTKMHVSILPWTTSFLLINVLFALSSPWLKARTHLGWFVLVWLFPWSRLFELAYAFYNDALDKLDKRTEKSHWERSLRLKLLGLSYVEAAACYGSLYQLCRKGSLQHDLRSGFDALYFSWVTITTTGYGDIVPVGWFPRLLVMSEVGLGLGLLVFIVGTYFSVES